MRVLGKFWRAGLRSLKRFGFFRLFVMVMLTYIAVALMFSSQLPPYEALRGGFQQQQHPEEDSSYWIEQLRLDKGLFLHVRHAARSESTDINGFDFWEQQSGQSSESIEDFVCLTDEGKAQAKLLGWAFQELDTPFLAISSPSCRARETAQMSLLGVDQIDFAHLYAGALPSGLKSSLDSERREFFQSFQFSDRETTVIFGHERLAYSDAEWVVREDGNVERSQGGISIMSWDSTRQQLTVHYTFATASEFAFAVVGN